MTRQIVRTNNVGKRERERERERKEGSCERAERELCVREIHVFETE